MKLLNKIWPWSEIARLKKENWSLDARVVRVEQRNRHLEWSSEMQVKLIVAAIRGRRKNMTYKPHEDTYEDGWTDAFNEAEWVIAEQFGGVLYPWENVECPDSIRTRDYDDRTS